MSTLEFTPQTQSASRLVYLDDSLSNQIISDYGSPCYVYSDTILRDRSRQALAFPAPYGLTVRYAMKANPLAAILKVFQSEGIQIDASSGAEVERAQHASVPADHIMLTSQEIPANLAHLVNAGVIYNACSLHQLDNYGRLFPGSSVSIRLNPGTGSGHRRSVSVGGPTSSFGIWHESAAEARTIAKRYHLRITGVHSHIGCGADPAIWHEAAVRTLELLEDFPEAKRLNLGGGFKVARYPGEQATDLSELGQGVSTLLTDFYNRTKRQLHLEIEPGTFLVANAGTLLANVIDLTNTGSDGYSFVKLNTGMNDFMRPALHASQHPIIPLVDGRGTNQDYVVVGHNCESTDLLTPDPNDSELPQPRSLPPLEIGDTVAIEGVGAYSSAMRLLGYNSFASPNEVLLNEDGHVRLINRRQTVADYTASEVS